jgi:hypothetical protein
MKLKFGFMKVRYRGLTKNAQPIVCDLRAGEPIHGSQEADGNCGVASPNSLELAEPASRRG